MKISFDIPAYNEAENIGDIVTSLRALPAIQNLEVVVDDGSTDATTEVAQAAGALVVRHPCNLGNCASVKSGATATGIVLLFMDAADQHQAADIDKLRAYLGEYDMMRGRIGESEVSRFRTVGNTLLIKPSRVSRGPAHRRADLRLSGGNKGVFRGVLPSVSLALFLSHCHQDGFFSVGRFVKYLPSGRPSPSLGLGRYPHPVETAHLHGTDDHLGAFLFLLGIMAAQLSRGRRELHASRTRCVTQP